MNPPKEPLADGVELWSGDCFDVVRGLADASIDSVVTDPPYALSFMGKQWDTGETAFAVEFWAEVLRVLKPGGHVAAFGGTRSCHRLACAIEDAGFEIRDQLAWTYGSGFPKSHDVSKGIDKAAGAEREVVGERKKLQSYGANDVYGDGPDKGGVQLITVPATDAARQWEGWGTALKPAWEPICLARKPLSEKTVAANVLRWGTGAINVDGCRIGTESRVRHDNISGRSGNIYGSGITGSRRDGETTIGRWPANLCHDGSPEVLATFPSPHGAGNAQGKQEKWADQDKTEGWGNIGLGPNGMRYGDSGSAARFFYCAKASKADRAGSKHPTVKPVKLMQWLGRMITPPGGTVLDPFAGTGTTGEAAWREGMRAILIEREAEYQDDIRRRMSRLASPRECGINSRSNQISIFDLCELEA